MGSVELSFFHALPGTSSSRQACQDRYVRGHHGRNSPAIRRFLIEGKIGCSGHTCCTAPPILEAWGDVSVCGDSGDLWWRLHDAASAQCPSLRSDSPWSIMLRISLLLVFWQSKRESRSRYQLISWVPRPPEDLIPEFLNPKPSNNKNMNNSNSNKKNKNNKNKL